MASPSRFRASALAAVFGREWNGGHGMPCPYGPMPSITLNNYSKYLGR
jgi:hypothetical protein